MKSARAKPPAKPAKVEKGTGPATATPDRRDRGSRGPGWTVRQRGLAVALVVVWAVLYLPNLRCNPNWYGDEGEWMEKCWTFIHGTPRVGPVTNDFIFPYPYPPLYMLVTGALLRVFGNDLLVARAVGVVTALAAAALLFWIGARLRDRPFGFLCAAAFLVYSEAVINYRWVRSHPLAGTLALAAIGLLIRYGQEKRLRDAVWAGVMCALATATNYFTYPLIGAVVVTVALMNWREWRDRRAWGRVIAAGAAAGAYPPLFVGWYVLAHADGWHRLLAQLGRLTAVAANEVRPTWWGEVGRFGQNVWQFAARTPTHLGAHGWEGRDWWLVIATAGFLFLPVAKRFRLWLPFWLLVLMFGVFRKLNNVPLFFYPATIFLPLLAVGFAGVGTWVSLGLGRLLKGPEGALVRWAPAVVAVGVFGLISLRGALGHFHTKIDTWTQHSIPEAEAAMRFVNAHTTSADFVLVPKQIYWLVRFARKSMLSHCLTYEGQTNEAWPVPIPRELFWFDCRWVKAKYLVLAAGIDPASRRPIGIDLVYTRNLRGVAGIVAVMTAEKWPVVFAGGTGVAQATVGPDEQWPIVVGGEYLVLANPRFLNTTEHEKAGR